MWTDFQNFFAQLYSKEILCTHYKDFYLTLNVLLYYRVKLKNEDNAVDFSSIHHRQLPCFILWHVVSDM